jgi:intracellular sulfur oxidation DsrE/DsrF family protein
MRKTGRKWSTQNCGRCGESHKEYSGKLDKDGVEYVVCGNTNSRINVEPQLSELRDIAFFTKWEKI